ncbi:hypothetical protein ACH4SP_00800 [Streptomyces sp. NPDC021093]|uniref:hypothetical protein n=1 Tax=Streptomyces sp. NPDC021093 TaxID=3365112 RepID=UPI0037901396
MNVQNDVREEAREDVGQDVRQDRSRGHSPDRRIRQIAVGLGLPSPLVRSPADEVEEEDDRSRVERTLRALVCPEEFHSGPCPLAWESGYGHPREAVEHLAGTAEEDYDPASLPVEATLTVYATEAEAGALWARARTELRIDDSTGHCDLTGTTATLELRDVLARDPEAWEAYEHLVEQYEIEHGGGSGQGPTEGPTEGPRD